MRMQKRELIANEAEDFLRKEHRTYDAIDRLIESQHQLAAILRIRGQAEDLLPRLHRASKTEVAAQLGYIISHCEDAETELRQR
jgi:hypothetical protein